MQISKISVMLCACVLATALNLSAQDNPAQAAARAALAAKLFEMDAQTPPVTNSATKAANPVTKTAPAPAVQSVSSKPPVMVPVGGDVKAKAASDKKAAAKEQAKADAKAKKMADQKAMEEKKAEQKRLAAQHEADVAAAKKQAKLNTDAAQKPPAVAVVLTPAPVMAAPPLPVSATKQQQLADLLNKYKADQLTPDEYQQQRAAILAQP